MGAKKQLIVTPALETVGVWNVGTGMIEGGHLPDEEVKSSEVSALALNADGTMLAIGYSKGGVCVCEFPSMETIFTSVQHQRGRAVRCLAWHPNGAMLASGAQDTDIIVWDVTSYEPVQHLKGHTSPVCGLKFLDKDLLLSAGYQPDCSLRVWDLKVGDCVQQVPLHHVLG